MASFFSSLVLGLVQVNSGGCCDWRMIVAKSDDGGAFYMNHASVLQNWDSDIDKCMLATGPDPNSVYIGYSRSSETYVASSIDAGLNFADNLQSPVNPGVTDGSIYVDEAISLSERLYAVWDRDDALGNQSRIMFNYSDDFGATWGWWTPPQLGVEIATTGVAYNNGFGYCVPALSTSCYNIATVPSIAVDRSNGPFQGRIYVAYTTVGGIDNPPPVGPSCQFPCTSEDPDTDIVVQYTDSDTGAPGTWSTPIRINDNPLNSQFLPWLEVDQVTGQVCVVWYDARRDDGAPANGNMVGNQHAEVYIGLSVDGGISWHNELISDGQSDESQSNGAAHNRGYNDYIGVAAHNSSFHTAWSDNSCDDADLDIMTQKIITWHVDAASTAATPDGRTWVSAYRYLQDALTAIEVDRSWTINIIRVAGGEYRPDESASMPGGSNDRTASFNLADNVRIIGGFRGIDGSGLNPYDRDHLTYTTILTGDLNDDDGTVGNSDNSYHVLTCLSTIDPDTLLEDVVVTAGNANGATVSNEDIGAGMLILDGRPRVRNCIFSGNAANTDGGAVYYSDTVGTGNPTFVNCLLIGNTAVANGGAMHIAQGTGSLINCTISGNSAGVAGGGLSLTGTTPTVTNCILWANTDSSGQGESAQISGGASPVVTYTCIEGCTATYCPANGNIATDPLFLDAGNGNYLLAGCSPCIDAADTVAVPPGITTDLAGLPRFLDDPQTTDSGNGAPPVDMGAYEYPLLCPNALGDMNADTQIDGNDIQTFVDCLIAGDLEASGCFCADMLVDGLLNMNDIPCFTAVLLGDTACVTCGGAGGRSSMEDCNGNGMPDATDIFVGTSLDCNLNGVPDECDISSQGSGDVNGNGVPDECDPDCNANGVPDDKDIADGTSGDVNSNGVPDECDPDCNGNGVPDDWDLLQGTSPDCNNNGLPDDCEEDCNGNGVPDDCDIDPTDPDGNGLVSADCNGNNWPDECDLALPPPFGSLDCDSNGAPDECDIADCLGDPACDDCNANGVPDACDISSGISMDADGNGIPDECEGQQAQSGGSSPTSESVTAFYEWCFTQEWGPNGEYTCSEQFQCMVNMEQSLGLPLGNPKYLPVSQE